LSSSVALPVGIRDEIEPDIAECELKSGVPDHNVAVGERHSIRAEDGELERALPVVGSP
jgi:hypothetical protein